MKNSFDGKKGTKPSKTVGPLTVKELSKLSYDEMKKRGYSVANPEQSTVMKEVVKLKTEELEKSIKTKQNRIKNKETELATILTKDDSKKISSKKPRGSKTTSKILPEVDEPAPETVSEVNTQNARVGRVYSRDTSTPTQGIDNNAVLASNESNTQEIPEAKNENVAYDEQKAADTKEELKKEENTYSEEFTKNIQTLYLTEESRLENLGVTGRALEIRLAEFKKRTLEPMLAAELERTGQKVVVEAEKEIINPELKNLHDGVEKTREDYVKGLVKFQKLDTLKSKISGMLGGSNEKKSEAEKEVKELKEKYDKARTELNTKLYRERKAQLEESGMSHGKIQTELANFRIEMLKQISVGEMALVNEKRAEQLPKSRLEMLKNVWDKTLKFVAKPISIYQKLGTDWGEYQKYNVGLIPMGKDKDGKRKYYRLGQVLRTVAMSTMFSTIGAGMLGVKLARSVGTTIGGSAAIDKLGKNIQEKKLNFANQKEELVGKFVREEINLTEYENGIQAIDKAERKAERINSLAGIAVAGLMLEANLAGGSGHMFGIDTHTGFNLDKTISDSLSNISTENNIPMMEQAGHFVSGNSESYSNNEAYKSKDFNTNPQDNTRVAFRPQTGQHMEVNAESADSKPQGWLRKIGNWFRGGDNKSIGSSKVAENSPFRNYIQEGGSREGGSKVAENSPFRNYIQEGGSREGGGKVVENKIHHIPKEAIIDSKQNVGITYALKSQIEMKGDAYAQEVAKAIGYNGDTHNPEFYKMIGEKFGYLGEGGGVGVQAGAAYELGFDNSGKLAIQEYGIDGKPTEIHHIDDNGNDLKGGNENYEYKYSNTIPKSNEIRIETSDELENIDFKPEVIDVDRPEIINNTNAEKIIENKSVENVNTTNTTDPYELKAKDVEVGNKPTNNEMSNKEVPADAKVDPYKLESKGIEVGTHPTDQNAGGNNINSYIDPYGLRAKGIEVGSHPTDNGGPHQTGNGPHQTGNGPHPTNNTRSVIDIINEKRMGIPRGGRGGQIPHDQYPNGEQPSNPNSGKVEINPEQGQIQRIKLNKAVDYIFGENRPSGRHIDGLNTREWSKMKDMSMQDIEERKHWFPLNQRNNADQIKHIMNTSGISYMREDGTSLTLKEYLEKVEAQNRDANYNATRHWLEQ